MPTARVLLTAAVVDGIIYAIGGNDGTSYVTTVEAYNPATNTWTAVAPMPAVRAYLGADAINGVLYVVGGEFSPDSEILTVYAFTPPLCGDGIQDPGEQCDDINTMAGDGCSSTCTIESGYNCTGEPSVCTTVSGDGLIKGSEQCDDNNTTAGDGCSSTGTIESGYNCTGEPSVCTTVCGDGLIKGSEQCDDGNTNNGDCCSSSCQFEPSGTQCSDNNACTQTDTCQAGVCTGGNPG